MTELYDIVKVPDPVLKQKAQEVQNIDSDILTQVERMMASMYHDRGIGLAANQVGLLNRIFVMDLPKDSWRFGQEIDGILTIEAGYRSGERDEEEDMSDPIVMINPEVVWESEQRSVYEEGCLSIPQQYADVIRPASVCVEYLNTEGVKQEGLFEGLSGHCVQHEIDHLDGVLFIDHISSLKRNMIMKRMKKWHKENQAL
ncbi:MAG: peptide deformylase [Micavibrio sp.]|nr:peptide deformylase [Micavibrio sp.]